MVRASISGLMAVEQKERVQVVVRCRPLSAEEIDGGYKSCVSVDTRQNTVGVFINGNRGASKVFTFDHVYDATFTQQQLYEDVAHPIVQSVMCGYNGTIFAYGQTSSGKTFTMEGLDHPSDMRGIIPQAFEDIFEHIRQSQRSDHFLVRASYLEIYNEEIRDLLSPSTRHDERLELKENPDSGVYVKNLASLTVNNISDIRHLLMIGKKNRSVGATLMNQDSSRSHSIFTITVETSSMSDVNYNNGSHIRVGKLNLVDLAGSERLSKSGATGERFKEMTKINWSLSALGNVISALVDGKSSHIPYRDSKLTRLLQDSLGGNTRTVMVANIGPAEYNYDETINTLRYASRAKHIKNKPHVNEDPKDAMIREFQEEIRRLKAQLEGNNLDFDLTKKHHPEVGHPFWQIQDHRHKDLGMEESQHHTRSEQSMACLKANLERKVLLELENLKAEKERSDEEKERVVSQLHQQLKELELQNQALAKGKDDRASLESKLKALEEKLLCGSNTDKELLLAKSRQQERELAHFQQQLQERQNLDGERQRKITELEEAQLLAEEKCNSMEEELDLKTRKLRKLVSRYQQSKQELGSLRTELQDTLHEFHQERTDLLWALRSLEQQHQLKSLIIERFIPPEEVAKIMKRVHWDEDTETWTMKNSHHSMNGGSVCPSQRPGSAVGRRRPTCQQTLNALAQGSTDPRYLEHNILKLEMDMPEKTTYNYEDPLERAKAETEILRGLSGHDKSIPSSSYESRPISRSKSTPRTRPIGR